MKNMDLQNLDSFTKIDKTITWRPQDKNSLKRRQVRLCLRNLILWRDWVAVVTMEKQQYFPCIVELHFTVKNIKLLSAEQQCLYGQLISPAKIKLLRFSHKVLSILVRFKKNWSVHIAPHVKFYGNPSSWNPVGTCGQTDRQKDITKLTDRSHGYVKASKNNWRFIGTWQWLKEGYTIRFYST